jgi:curved DNA-binding protein CbpA
MSTLSSNPEEWPRDPFELLGLRQENSAEEARRAYTRLVRKYRPDENPQEFQRIRAAYEVVTQVIEARSRFDAAQEGTPRQASGEATTFDESGRGDAAPARSDDGTGDSSTPSLDVAFPQSRHDSRGVEKNEPTFAESVDAAWNLVREGSDNAAFAALIALRDRTPQDPEPWLRLYWLRLMAPALDPARFPAEWLIEGLQATGFSPRLLRPYCSELERSAALIHCEVGYRLLDAEAPLERLLEAARSRWRAASRVNAWGRIDQDLDALRRQLMIDHPDQWVDQIFTALDYAVWSSHEGARKLADRCQRELAGFRDRELALAQLYERHAYVVELAGDPHVAGNILFDETMRRLIRSSWNATYSDLLPDLQQLARKWLDDPAAALSMVTTFALSSAVGFEQLWRLVRQLPIPEDLQPNRDRVEYAIPRITQFMNSVGGHDYRGWRASLLEFCIREMIWPSEILDFLANRKSWYGSTDQVEAMQGDAPMFCIVCVVFSFLATLK